MEKRYLLRAILASLLVVIGIIVFLIILGGIIGRIRQTAIDESSIPTAQALLNMPSQIVVPSRPINLRLNYIPDGRGVSSEVWEGYNVICVEGRFLTDYFDDSEIKSYRNNSRLYVNDSLIMGALYTSYIFVGALTQWTEEDWCAHGHLQSGLHLIEFHLRDSLLGEPLHIQQWAIEVE